jgi:hypothetical protein
MTRENPQETMEDASKRWKSMLAPDKAIYKHLRDFDKERYDSEKDLYNKIKTGW